MHSSDSHMSVDVHVYMQGWKGERKAKEEGRKGGRETQII